MINRLILLFCAVFFALSLTACAVPPDPANVTEMPSVTAGARIMTVTGKVTEAKGNMFTLDVNNSSVSSTVVGEEVSASPSGEETSTPGGGMTTGVQVEIPTNTAVTLKDGTSGALSDVKKGSVVTITMVNSIVTAVAVM